MLITSRDCTAAACANNSRSIIHFGCTLNWQCQQLVQQELGVPQSCSSNESVHSVADMLQQQTPAA
jgi:hypothetical protein